VMLPLDEDLPDARKRTMLKEGKASFLLLTSNQQFSPDEGIRPICIDEYTCQTEGSVSTWKQFNLSPSSSVDAAAPCYIFFTSGTTATPKGIVGCHKGLAHFVSWEQNAFTIGLG